MWEVKGRAETLILGHNAAWAREPVLLRASRVEVVVELMPLLEQQLHMRDARADNITVNLERGKNGERSWVFKQAAGDDVARFP